MVNNPPTMREIWVRFLRWEDPLEEGMATHSSILAWRIPMDRGSCWSTVHGVAKSWTSIHGIFHARVLEWGAIAFSHIYAQACLNNWLLSSFGMPMMKRQSIICVLSQGTIITLLDWWTDLVVNQIIHTVKNLTEMFWVASYAAKRKIMINNYSE